MSKPPLSPVILISMNVAPVGGLTADVLKCVRALRAQGREVHVAYGFRGLGTLESVNDPGVRWHHMFILKRPPLLAQLMVWISSLLIVHQIKRNAPDAIICCFERLPIGHAVIGSPPYALWAEARKRMGKSPFSKLPLQVWNHYIDRYLWHKFTGKLVVYSERDIQALMQRGVAEERIVQVAIPTDTKRFRAYNASDRSYITIIGADPRLKGIDLALDVWPELSRRFPEYKLRVVTQGWKVKMLLEKLKLPKVEMAPFRSDVEYYYHTSRLVLMPSMFESWGNVIPEALACGIPVVASSDVPSSELINAPEMGVVFQRDGEHDAERLEAAIEQALKLGMDDQSMTRRHDKVEKYMKEKDDLLSWITTQ